MKNREFAVERMDRIASKIYYSIGEVSDLTGLEPHVLRYWESQFDSLNIKKNRAGNRVFVRKDIDLVFLLKHLLYERKFSIKGARLEIADLGGKPTKRSKSLSAQDEYPLTKIWEGLRELREVFDTNTSADESK